MRFCVQVSLVCLLLVSASGVAWGRGDFNRAACANEASPGFRAYLPDCRAYEMVTPSYKDGFPVVFRNVRTGEFSGSEAPLVVGSSLGAFAGGSDQVASARGNDYAFVRGAAGWEAKPLDPSPTQYVMNSFPSNREGEALAISESGTALMMLHTQSESIFGSDLYSRSLGGELALVGSALPPQAVPSEPVGLAYERNRVHFAGASADLSHLLYYIAPSAEGLPSGISTNLWPADTTKTSAPSSLYEYAGIGEREPSLVGVEDNGELIGQCGTTLGGPVVGEDEGNARGAVSTDGSTVFFTVSPQCPNEGEPELAGYGPPSYELFARIGGQHTISISEPSPEECEGQCAGVPVGGASFQGASQDGTKVFFLSTQKLLPDATEDSASHEEDTVPDDAVEGGGCPAATGGAGCNLYEYDAAAPAAHNLTLVSAGSSTGAQVQGVAAVADDGSHVYFVARGLLCGANAEGASPVEGGENLYVFEEDAQTASEQLPNGRTVFVATLGEAETEALQWSADGAAPMDLTPDGRVLVFESEANLTSEGASSAPQVFKYEAETRTEAQRRAASNEPLAQLTRVSVGTEGVAAAIPHAHFEAAETPGASDHPAVSSDGEVIVFTSTASLAPGLGQQANGQVSYVYEYEGGRVSLVSDPSVTTGAMGTFFGSRLLGIDPSGRDIFFETDGALVPQDSDTLADLYDARVEGGFSAPRQVSACASSCQVTEILAPTLPSPATGTQPAGQNQAPAAPAVVKRLTRAELLAKALRSCRREARKRRRACQANARHRYGSPVTKKSAKRHR
jgi:hypothetical protein